MKRKPSGSTDNARAQETAPPAPPREGGSNAIANAVRELRTDVVDIVGQLAQDRVLGTHRDELRAALGRDVDAATARLRAEIDALMTSRGEDLGRRIALVDGLLRDLTERLTDGARRLDEIDRRVTSAHVERLVEEAARTRAETVYERSFQAGVDALTEAFGEADDRLQQLRAYIDTFGPGGLPVVAQERDALRGRVDDLVRALDTAHREILELKEAVAERDAAALRRRVVEGIDPEVLDRRLAAVAERERALEAQEALATDNGRLTTEIERLRAALAKWEATGRAEQEARVDAAELHRLRAEAANSDRERTTAERTKSALLAERRRAEETIDRLSSELRTLDQERAAAEDRSRRLDAITEENRAFRKQFEEQKRLQSDHERALRDAEIERGNLVAEILALQREVNAAADAGRRAEAERRAESLKAYRTELDQWAEAEAEGRAHAHVARADALAARVEALLVQLTAKDLEIERRTRVELETQTKLQAAQIELAAVREAHDKRLALLEAEVRASEARVLQAARTEAERVREAAAQDAERMKGEAAAHAERVKGEAKEEADRLTQMADEALASRDALVAEVQAWSAHKGELEAQIERLKLDLWDLKERVVPAEERIRSLDAPVFSPEDLRPVGPSDEEREWLALLESGIEKAGFVFHPRLVRAFHTSLKIAHHAPLVVLAGISGTGKSELPRLYADLGGVPFLPLAVQPSWDSPHDLFGFFNYTDGRLKAEPLARLFRQIEDKEGALRQSPCLVLLDEMNLARVEYYFAELLSKLEVRRSVRGSGDAERRKRASVSMDTGPDGGDLPLYLDERVLFVGTMNQDESTLTLSDKVLDRACLLTFPAPRQMRLTTQEEAPRRAQRISWETWTGWTREPAAGENEEKLNAVNRSMADLGRPFGHRLFRAIHAYVENYPGSKEDAFSDQFAMKVLPRLGGLECQSRKIRDGLDALEPLVPGELTGAFARAREHEFFTWGGEPDLYQVDRA